MGFIVIGLLISGYIMYTGAQEAQIPAVRYPRISYCNATKLILAMLDHGRQLSIDQQRPLGLRNSGEFI
jgi:hypothetical protein